MKPNRWMRWVIAISILAILTTGCSLGGNDKSQPIDPPPSDGETDAADPTSAEATENSMEVTMYFKDANGYVAPISMAFPQNVEVGKLALSHMVKGGPGELALPAGFSALLPAGTEVLGMNIIKDEKLAIVDFSEEIASYDAKDERKILEAVTWTLTEFPTVERVQLRVNGHELKEMPVAGTPLDLALTRKMGINLERDNGVNLAQATPVTLYFKGTAEDMTPYLVPVTRLIDRTDNVLEAALNELEEGPSQSSKLANVLLPGVEVLGLERADHVINVNFNNAVVTSEQTVSEETLRSVVLSLLENSDATHVQLMVDGSVQTSTESGEAISEPVSRPHGLNKIEL